MTRIGETAAISVFGPNRRRRRNSPHKGRVLRLAAVYYGRVSLGFYAQGVIKGIPKLSRALVAIEKDVMMLVSTVRSMALLVLPLLLASPAMGQAGPGAPPAVGVITAQKRDGGKHGNQRSHIAQLLRLSPQTGRESSQTSPSLRQSKRAFPFSWVIIPSMMRPPTPLRVGSCTAGPPVSVHRRRHRR
jgi:hypothetical protein